MSTESATNYANSLAATIRARVDAGAPFGIIHDMEGWADVDGQEYADWRNNPETEWCEATALDYLSDVLEIHYLVSADRTYRAARVLIAYGGPTAWIDTRTGQIEVSWWSPAFADLPLEFIDGLNDALAELWEMGA